MKKTMLLSVLMLLVGVGGAEARTTVLPETGRMGNYQRWVDTARAPTPNVTLCMSDWEQAGNICPHSADPSLPYFAYDWEILARHRDNLLMTFWHELGHGFDYYEMEQWSRQRFLQIIGDERGWREPLNFWHDSPHELFAESYALCARYGRRIRRLEYWGAEFIQIPPVGRIGPKRQHRICRVIRIS